MLRTLLRSLRRRTSTGNYLPELDGLRFVAIASVFLYHLSGDLQRHSPPGTSFHSLWLLLMQQLAAGVPVFFVISGMILSLPFAGHHLLGARPVRLRTYWMRRLTRLEPVYILVLLICFVLKIAGHRGAAQDLWPHLLASVFYVHNLAFGLPSTINIIAWSLEVEIQFYLLLPVLVAVFRIRGAALRRAIVATAILIAALAAEPAPGNALLRLTVLGNLHYFLTGFLLADLYLTGALAKAEALWWDAVTLCGWPLLAAGLVYGGLYFRMFLPAVLLLLFCAVFKGSRSSRIFSGLVITSVGGMCYSIYLIHNYVIAATGFVVGGLLAHANFATRLAVQSVLHAIPVLLASLVLYKLVEQPCMDPQWPARLWRRLTGTVSPSGLPRTVTAPSGTPVIR